MRKLVISSVATLAVACVVFALLHPPPKVRFADFALGPGTSSMRASVDGIPVHCGGVTDGTSCVDAAKDRPVVLWLGNSQLHGVNQLRPGQENAAPQVYRALRDEGLHAMTFSQGNANLQEHLALFEWVRRRTRLETVLLALCFDDLRETGLRPGISEVLADAEVNAALGASAVGRSIISAARTAGGGGELAGLDQTVQQQVEAAASEWLADHFPPWAMRQRTRTGMQTRLYQLRNTVFRITPHTKRRMIPSRHARNLAALEQLLASARDAGVRVVTYIAPIRTDHPLPYDATVYALFKRKARALAQRYNARLLDLETLVPPQWWGRKRAVRGGQGEFELDFMHFQAPGHALLATAVIETLRGRPGVAGRR